MRDKFIFEENPNPASLEHGMRQGSISQVLGANKKSRKLLATTAQNRLQGNLQAASDAAKLQNRALDEAKVHGSLNEYERDHLNIGSWPRIKGSLKLRWRNLRMNEAGNGTVELFETINGIDGRLGTVYPDHLRFVALDSQPGDVINPVYVRRQDPRNRHYIKVPATKVDFPDVFVRRFVIRGLNGHNVMELDTNKPMKAAHYTKVAAFNKPQPTEIKTNDNPHRHPLGLHGTTLSDQEMLFSHTRGWKKRYISAGVGNKPPLSTRGTVFVSLFGNVAIDLAKIPTDQLFDLHTPTAAHMNLGLDPKLVVTQGNGYPATDHDGEKFLGLRDVLRTREMVIKREVPFSACVQSKKEKVILAIGFPQIRDDTRAEALKIALNTQGAPLPIPAPANKEIDDFLWSDQKRWFFLQYLSAGECDTAALAARTEYGAVRNTSIETHYTYEFHAPAGMVLEV